ncbi:MAG TPA: hypothetical protein DD979_01315 [Gammaproteobacteria bacterium]|nr:hypothetical protein [Gammaproteobacteria bacterium]
MRLRQLLRQGVTPLFAQLRHTHRRQAQKVQFVEQAQRRRRHFTENAVTFTDDAPQGARVQLEKIEQANALIGDR